MPIVSNTQNKTFFARRGKTKELEISLLRNVIFMMIVGGDADWSRNFFMIISKCFIKISVLLITNKFISLFTCLRILFANSSRLFGYFVHYGWQGIGTGRVFAKLF